MNRYSKGKEKVKQKAIDFQNTFLEGKSWFYSELSDFLAELEAEARKYGLLRELRKEGIL